MYLSTTNPANRIDVDLLAARVYQAMEEEGGLESLQKDLIRPENNDQCIALKNIFPDLYRFVFPALANTLAPKVDLKEKKVVDLSKEKAPAKKIIYQLGDEFIAQLLSFEVKNDTASSLITKLITTEFSSPDSALSALQSVYEELQKDSSAYKDLLRILGLRMSTIGFEEETAATEAPKPEKKRSFCSTEKRAIC